MIRIQYMTVYADYGTINRSGNKVTMLFLSDYNIMQLFADDRYLSSITLDEYDCEKKSTRVLSYQFYSGHMATGGVIYSQSDAKDEPRVIKPGSKKEKFLMLLCNTH